MRLEITSTPIPRFFESSTERSLWPAGCFRLPASHVPSIPRCDQSRVLRALNTRRTHCSANFQGLVSHSRAVERHLKRFEAKPIDLTLSFLVDQPHKRAIFPKIASLGGTTSPANSCPASCEMHHDLKLCHLRNTPAAFRTIKL